MMHPLLFSLGGFEIHTYGVLLALGFILGVAMATKQAGDIGLDVDKVTNILLLVLACSIVGARSIFVGVNWPHFAAHPADIFALHRGGLVYYGGLLGGIVSGVFGAWMYRIPVPVFADIVPAGLCIGQFLGRLGCLFNGCCYGMPTDLPWGLRLAYGPGALAARHPTQLYEAGLVAAIGAISYRLFYRRHRPGMVMVLYLYLYGLGRFAIELTRGDARGAFVLGLSVSQWISAGILGLAVVCHLLTPKVELKADVSDPV